MRPQATNVPNELRPSAVSGPTNVPVNDAVSADARSRRPRILLVTDRPPGGDSGYGMRVDNVIVGLMKAGDLHVCLIDSSIGGASLPLDAGYETSVVRAENPPKWQKLWLAFVALAHLPYQRTDHLRLALAARLRAEPWDVVWFSRARTYSICKGLFRAKTVVDFDDLNDTLSRGLIADRNARYGRVIAAPRNLVGTIEAWRWSRLQRQIADEVSCVTVCSEDDRSYLGFDNCAVVTNGYRIPTSVRRSPNREQPTLLFVGPMSYEPNRLAAEWLAFELLPRVRRVLPTAHAVLIGYNGGVSPRLRDAQGVTLTGYVHDLGSYYAMASVAVAPLRSGGGTRLKVAEALARSVPLVATSVGCYGLGLTHDQEVLIADDAESFAAACISIIKDPMLAKRLAEAGLARYLERLTSDASSDAVADVASSLLAASESAREHS